MRAATLQSVFPTQQEKPASCGFDFQQLIVFYIRGLLIRTETCLVDCAIQNQFQQLHPQ